jgi:hypothetical protein
MNSSKIAPLSTDPSLIHKWEADITNLCVQSVNQKQTHIMINVFLFDSASEVTNVADEDLKKDLFKLWVGTSACAISSIKLNLTDEIRLLVEDDPTFISLTQTSFQVKKCIRFLKDAVIKSNGLDLNDVEHALFSMVSHSGETVLN